MIITRENQTLFLGTWEYNAALIISTLANIIKEHGGTVKPVTPCKIVNRSISDKISEKKDNLVMYERAIENHGDKAAITAKLNELKERTQSELKELESKERNIKPVDVSHTSYISFILDGVYYYYQVDRNPLFDFLYCKTPVVGDKYSRDACLENDTKAWLWRYDCFKPLNDDEITQAANTLFEMLVKANFSVKRIDRSRIRVANTYNNGFHYEFKQNAERFEKITWLEA